MATVIDVVNASNVMRDDQLRPIVDALQTQVSRDWAPIWGVDAELHFVPRGTRPNAHHWWLVVLDTSDVADALGYHDITSAGMPLGKVFAKSDLDSGSSVSVTMSHELLEMLGDPDINLLAFVETGRHRGFYAYEVCDPVEADNLGYTVNGILVSNFVYPAYFEAFRRNGPFDFGKHVKNPFEILAGGYQSVYVPGQGWTQVTAEGHPLQYWQIARKGARRERRRRNRAEWLPSQPVG